jgi:hypothetical protein
MREAKGRLWPIASFRVRETIRSLLERSGHQPAGRAGWLGRLSIAMQGAWPVPEGIKSVEVNGYPMAYKALSNLAPATIICIG